MEEWIPTLLSPKMPPGPTSPGASYQTRVEEWIPTCPSPEMPPGPTSAGQGSDQDGKVDTHSSESRHAPGPTSSGASYRTRMEEWTPTCLSPEMPPGLTSPGQGSDQDGGVDTHSSESRHAPGPTSSGASHRTRVEEWTPTHPSPEMPPGLTSPGQGSDQDGGVDTHSSESRHAPGPTSSGASHRTRVEEWIPTQLSPEIPLVRPVVVQAIRPGWRSGYPLILVQRCPLVRPVLGRGQTRMEEWIPTHLSPDMPLVGPVVVQAIGPGWRSGYPLVLVQRCPLVRPVLGRGQTRMEEWIPTHLSPDMPLVQPVVVQVIGPGWRSGHPLVQVQRCPLVRLVLGRGQTRMEEWIPTHLSPDMPLVQPVVVQAIRPDRRSVMQ